MLPVKTKNQGIQYFSWVIIVTNMTIKSTIQQIYTCASWLNFTNMLSDQKKFEKIVNIYLRLSIRNFTWISTALTLLVTLLLARSTKQNIQYNFKHKHSRYFSLNRWIYFLSLRNTYTHHFLVLVPIYYLIPKPWSKNCFFVICHF